MSNPRSLSIPVRRALALLVPALVVTLFGALASACALRREPPAGADGATIFKYQLCANCHGANGQGSGRGPALLGLEQHWDQTGLAEFLRDPKAATKADARLGSLAKQYRSEMRSYEGLNEEQRRVLAAWLLELK